METMKIEPNHDNCKILFAVILETVLLQLNILDGCSKLRCAQHMPLEGDSPFNSQILKNIKERLEIKDIIQKTFIDIIFYGKWERLTHTVNNFSRKLLAESSLRYSHQELKSTRENIICEIKKSSEHHETLLRIADKKIAMLKDLLEDNVINAASVLIYSEKWLNARRNTLECKASKLCKLPNLQHEQRVHDELGKAFEVQIKELQSNIENWKVKYAEDTTDIKKRVADTKEKLKITTHRRQNMEQLYNLHAGEMRSWLTFKAEKAARLAREKRRRDSTIKLQAWWRGVMVRKALGAFRYLRNVKKSPAKSKKK